LSPQPCTCDLITSSTAIKNAVSKAYSNTNKCCQFFAITFTLSAFLTLSELLIYWYTYLMFNFLYISFIFGNIILRNLKKNYRTD
jgi:hypothetical protein